MDEDTSGCLHTDADARFSNTAAGGRGVKVRGPQMDTNTHIPVTGYWFLPSNSYLSLNACVHTLSSLNTHTQKHMWIQPPHSLIEPTHTLPSHQTHSISVSQEAEMSPFLPTNSLSLHICRTPTGTNTTICFNLDTCVYEEYTAPV